MHALARKVSVGATAGAAVLGMSVSMAAPANAALLDADPDFTPNIQNNTTYRIAGNDRISTAIFASQARTDWDCAVVVARQDDFADALSAGPLADVLDAPILVNPRSGLDTRVRNEVRRLNDNCDGTLMVHIVGGTGAISEGTQNALDAIVGADQTLRYQGANRFETSVAVSVATIEFYTEESITDINVFLATGNDFADAMTAGTAAASDEGVVLLTNGDNIESQTRNFLFNLSDYVPGTEANVAEIVTVGGWADAAWPDSDKSFVGSDRYETASMLADEYFDWSGNLSSPTDNVVGLASGKTYADATVAAGFMANADGPLLLTNPEMLNGFAEDYLESQATVIDQAFVFGGLATISDRVADEVDDALYF